MESFPKDMLGKGLWLLTRLGTFPAGAGVSQLADETGLPVSTTHRLLGTLVDHGFASYEPASRTYRMGLRVFELSQQLKSSWGDSRVREALSKLAADTGETVLMSVLVGDEMVYIEHVEGASNLRVKGSIGGRGPLHCTAMGKVLLATMPTSEQTAVVERLTLHQHAPKTITSRERLRRELRQVRRRGYAIADEEYELDIRTIAVPVHRGVSDQVMAAVCVSAPVFRAPSELLLGWLPLLQSVCQEISLVAPAYERR